MSQLLLYSNWEPKRASHMNSKLRCTVAAGIYTRTVQGLNDPIKENKVICYLKDRKILHFIRISSRYKVKVLMAEPESPSLPFRNRSTRVSTSL